MFNSRGSVSIQLIVVIIVIIAAGYFLYNTFIVEKPEDVVNKFIQAFNERDLNTAVTCFDPKYERAYNLTNKILNSVVGFNISDFSDALPFMLEYVKAEDENYTDIYLDITDIVSKQINGDKATILASIKATNEYGKVIDGGNSYFYLKKFNAGWRIIDMK